MCAEDDLYSHSRTILTQIRISRRICSTGNDLSGEDLLLEGDTNPDMMNNVRDTIEATISGLESIEHTMELALKHPDDMPIESIMLVLQTAFVMKQNLVLLRSGIEMSNTFSEGDLSRLNMVISAMNILDAFMKGNVDQDPVNEAKDFLKSVLPSRTDNL
jgi:hypothetical protein